MKVCSRLIVFSPLFVIELKEYAMSLLF